MVVSESPFESFARANREKTRERIHKTTSTGRRRKDKEREEGGRGRRRILYDRLYAGEKRQRMRQSRVGWKRYLKGI